MRFPLSFKTSRFLLPAIKWFLTLYSCNISHLDLAYIFDFYLVIEIDTEISWFFTVFDINVLKELIIYSLHFILYIKYSFYITIL